MINRKCHPEPIEGLLKIALKGILTGSTGQNSRIN